MTSPTMSPWHPTTNLTDLAVLGKLLEELGECTAATARCAIQGITEREPVTDKPNRNWLEEEIGDVLAGIEMTIRRFELSRAFILARRTKKIGQLEEWHGIIKQKTADGDWPLLWKAEER